MSVYGGFPTRQVENVYNQCIFNVISLLQFRVKELYESAQFTPLEFDFEFRFKKMLASQYLKLYRLDQSKHLKPRFSYAMRDLAKYFGVYKKTDKELREQGHEMVSPE